MARHTVKIEELAEPFKWLKTFTLASSHGAGEYKDLFIESRVNGNGEVESHFVVESGKKRLYSDTYLDLAVQVYNEA